VHADDLHGWETFPRCQDFAGITYGEYRAERRALELRRRSVSALIDAQAELERLDTDDLVESGTETIEVPRRRPFRRTVRVPLREGGAWAESDTGIVRDATLEVETRWRRQLVDVVYRGESRRVHAPRIDELRRKLGSMSDEQRRTIDEVKSSRFAQPVLFISHRWDDPAHPDPSGSQLRRLRALKDCFLIYDYSSFPQPPRSAEEESDFHAILGSMSSLVRRVVVLGAPDYLTRGWCVYEYVVASLHGSTVCDELQDARFVALRDWSSTPPPAALSFRDGFESQQQNVISERVLAAMNEVLPIYDDGAFTEPQDREVVTTLLIDHLKETLPAMKRNPGPYGGGEWETTQWTTESLAPFFAGEAEVPDLESSIPLARFDSAVPASLDEAVERRYAIERYAAVDLLDPQDSVLRALSARG
jgi:hypothetical protein